MSTRANIPVYARDEHDPKHLRLVGWATKHQKGAEIAGRHLPTRHGFWKRAIKKNGYFGTMYIVEYIKPTAEQAEQWALRPYGHPTPEEAKLYVTTRTETSEQADKLMSRIFNKDMRHRIRPRIQTEFAHG